MVLDLDLEKMIGDGEGLSLLCILAGLSLLLIVLWGFLFHYFVIQELKKTNKNLQDLNEILGYNLTKLHQQQNTNVQNQQQLKLKTNDESQEK